MVNAVARRHWANPSPPQSTLVGINERFLDGVVCDRAPIVGGPRLRLQFAGF